MDNYEIIQYLRRLEPSQVRVPIESKQYRLMILKIIFDRPSFLLYQFAGLLEKPLEFICKELECNFNHTEPVSEQILDRLLEGYKFK